MCGENLALQNRFHGFHWVQMAWDRFATLQCEIPAEKDRNGCSLKEGLWLSSVHEVGTIRLIRSTRCYRAWSLCHKRLQPLLARLPHNKSPEN